MKPVQTRRPRQPIHAGAIAGRRRERGAFAMMTIIFMTVMIAILGMLDIGNVFFQRRDLQRIADMAALAGVQRLDTTCTQAPVSAKQSATNNGLDASAGDTISIGCGRWDPTINPAPSYYVPVPNPGASSPAVQLNAVQVAVSRQVPYFFLGPTRTVYAMSTSRATAIDAFSVGATLAQLGGTSCAGTPASSSANPGLVNGLLGALLGAKSGLNLSLVSYQALACTSIKLGDLALAAQAGTIDQLLAAKLSLSKFLSVVASAASQTSVVNANLQAAIGALQALGSANLNSANINLGGPNGVLNVALANTKSAADAQVNLLDLVMVGAEIANSGNAVALNMPALALGGLAGTQLQVQIISPPSIAVGEGGKDASGNWRTQASTAAVGIYLVVDLGTQTLPILGPLLQLVGVNVNVMLPVYIQVGTGTAVLESTQCAQTPQASTATITATPGIANLCIGTPPLNAKGLINLSSSYSCTSPAQIVNAKLSLLNLVNIAQLTVSLANVSVQVQGAKATHVFSGVAGLDANYWTVNSNALGSTLANALTQLSGAKISPNVTLFGASVVSVPGNFVSTVLGILTSALSPLLSSLDAVIVPLLNLLGVQVGAATVHQISLNCGVAQTVY
ncbi:TadG family pilus assembly protein [Burkholderia perseverans]|uniref:TadG family pilus assembly protein n=1 Tax=Burkholderia perseverans TaxID=2615214 RepID=UPI001FEFC7D6|nr:TadG family pilus assembly protein [Burkholderia perseverans]